MSSKKVIKIDEEEWEINIFYEDGTSFARYYFIDLNCWYDSNGNYHREDGPAVEYSCGKCKWFLHGQELSCTDSQSFESLMKMKAFW
jgi:hypothetical protein